MKTFKSLIEFQKHFDTDDKCRDYIEQQRWGGIPICPYCDCHTVYKFKDGKRFNCGNPDCKRVFSVTVGTIYENTKLPLTKWFVAMYLLSVHSKGISSLQLAGFLGITQKSAWHLTHRIRQMLTDKDPELLTGTVEVDEVYIGGSDKNRHHHKKKGKDAKAMVLGLVQRQGKVRVKVIEKTTIENVQQVIKDTIAPDSTMYTDESHAYKRLKHIYKHDTVKHRDKEYVRGDVSTNTIEGYWSLLRRQIDGIHHSISPKHLQRYCNESAFRYNNKLTTQDIRFVVAIGNCEGGLKYKDLIK